MTALQTALAEIAVKRPVQERARLRRQAATYQRDAATLSYWMLAGRHQVIANAALHPYSPEATKALCHALWDDYTTALRLPKYLSGKRPVRIAVLRELFACECALYRNQTRRVAQAAE